MEKMFSPKEAKELFPLLYSRTLLFRHLKTHKVYFQLGRHFVHIKVPCILPLSIHLVLLRHLLHLREYFSWLLFTQQCLI